MPKAKGKEAGSRENISVRAGLDIPQWGGINRQEDPGAIGDHEFQNLINVRYKKTKLVDRPGLTKINTNAVSGEIRGMFDPLLNGGTGGDPELQEVAGVADCATVTGYGTSGSRLYWVNRDSCANNYILFHYAPDQSPIIQKIYTDPGTTHENAAHGHYGLHPDLDKLWVTTGAYDSAGEPRNYEVRTLPARHFSAPPASTVSFSPGIPTGPHFSQNGAGGSAEFLRDRYFSNSQQLSVSLEDITLNVWRWDGRTVTLEDTVTEAFTTSVPGRFNAYSTSLFTYREELVRAICSAFASEGNDPAAATTAAIQTANVVRKRTTAGVWSTVSLPGTVSWFAASWGRMAVYKDKLYIFGFGVMPAVHATNVGGIVLAYDGTSLTVAQNTISAVASTNSDSSTLRNPVLFGGYLYYLYSPSASRSTVYVSRFDGTTWDNTHVQISLQSTVAHPTQITFMESFRGNLAMVAYSPSGTPVGRLLLSPGANTGGTWTVPYSINNFVLARNSLEGTTPGSGATFWSDRYGFSFGVL